MFKVKSAYIINIKLYVSVLDVFLCMIKDESEKKGRNIGLVNKVTLEILEHALIQNRYLSMGELVDGIHHPYKEKGKKSAEYKQIKKLLPKDREKTNSRFRFPPLGFIDVKERNNAPQQKIQRVYNIFREVHGEYSQALYDYEDKIISSDELKVKKDRENNASEEYRRVIQRYQIYSPNFRGLLLYLYLCKILRLKDYNRDGYKNTPGRIKAKVDTRTSTSTKRKHSRTVWKIRRIIDKNQVLEQAPFLKYWQDFEKCGFNVIELLLQISEELYSQLHIDAENDRYLLRRASERYFVEVENYCYERIDDPFYFLAEITPDERNLLTRTRHKYRTNMVPLLKEWIQKQQERIDYIDDKRKEVDIAQDTSFDKDKVILFNDLASKYGANIAKVSKALGLHYNNDPSKPDYYPHDTKKFLVTNTCLIPVQELDNLKPTLSNGMNFLDVSSLFEKHGIPESCHQEIIPKLGFEIIKMQWNDTKSWFIVERSLSNIETFFRTYLK